MFRLSLHIGPLHIDVAIGDDEEVVVYETDAPSPFSIECPSTFDDLASEYDEEWEE